MHGQKTMATTNRAKQGGIGPINSADLYLQAISALLIL